MLVLSLKEGKSLFIGDDVVITAERVDRGAVRLSIDAPREIRVDRAEVRERILVEGLRAKTESPAAHE